MAKDLTGIPNKEGTMLTVQYLPGGASMAHRHDAHVFVYVLEGAVKMQEWMGSPLLRLRLGRRSTRTLGMCIGCRRMRALAQPAKILVFMVKDKDKAATRPAN